MLKNGLNNSRKKLIEIIVTVSFNIILRLRCYCAVNDLLLLALVKLLNYYYFLPVFLILTANKNVYRVL